MSIMMLPAYQLRIDGLKVTVSKCCVVCTNTG